jgi:hypothetical protein
MGQDAFWVVQCPSHIPAVYGCSIDGLQMAELSRVFGRYHYIFALVSGPFTGYQVGLVSTLYKWAEGET